MRNLTAVALVLAACSSAPTASTRSAMDLDEPDESTPTYDPRAPIEIERSRTGTIDRGTLDSILERGIGNFLRKVEVDPVLSSGTFRGWRVVRYDHPWVDLRPGDIVHSINGSRVESPREAQILWAELASADEIVVEVARQDESFELRFDVLGEPEAAEP